MVIVQAAPELRGLKALFRRPPAARDANELGQDGWRRREQTV